MAKITKAFIWVLVLGFTACWASDIRVAICDVLASPKTYHEKEVIVSGSMFLAFEHSSLSCLDSTEKKGVSSVWISFDLPSIEKHSPQFVAELRADLDRANRWVGGARREVIVRGHLQFCEEALQSKEVPPFGGFGHLGSQPGEIVVTEILEYGPNTAAEGPEKSEKRANPSKADTNAVEEKE